MSRSSSCRSNDCNRCGSRSGVENWYLGVSVGVCVRVRARVCVRACVCARARLQQLLVMRGAALLLLLLLRVVRQAVAQGAAQGGLNHVPAAAPGRGSSGDVVVVDAAVLRGGVG